MQIHHCYYHNFAHLNQEWMTQTKPLPAIDVLNPPSYTNIKYGISRWTTFTTNVENLFKKTFLLGREKLIQSVKSLIGGIVQELMTARFKEYPAQWVYTAFDCMSLIS